ncbi:hypothetical protein [Fundidesulfovibrio terrae]|uniref:hypothetical protein n=1 Tax=Fundidesulfovibrio terrae TaxID=2922866 RepID=UPI001FAEF862|nr:hypothetical protein [Fundidesulfovibrio terrae]
MRHALALLSLVLTAALATACADTDRYSQWKCGESVKATMQSQVLNPEAGGDQPVAGMDGVVAERAIERYEKRGEAKNGQGVMEKMVDLYGGKQQESK